MMARRVGKTALAGASNTPDGTSRGFSLSRALASPYGILIVFPGIVLAVGVFLALVGQRALKVSNVALGERRLAEQAQLVASRLRGALDSADPMLDRLSDFTLTHTSDKPFEPAAAVLADLMQGRAGVAYASISFPDGTFQATYIDQDGAVRFQDSRIGPDGTHVRRYDFQGHGLLTLHAETRSAYDPRKRDFYTQASATRGRVWTAPYVFYGTHYTGITRAGPVYLQANGDRRLHAVLTVDFDVNELSRLLRSGELPGMRTLLFTRAGTLLAYQQGGKGGLPPAPADHVLSYRDLHDATLEAFFGAFAQRASDAQHLLSFDAGGAQHLVGISRVSPDDALDWRVAYVVPERVFFESLHVYGRRSFGIAAVAVLLALGVSVAFARLVVKVRREAAEARAEAKRANLEARELGSYRLVKCLGKGGMGEVWRAEHRLLAREAAIKLIRVDSAARSSAEAQERFRREAQSLAGLRSRNTIELFDYGVADDGTFFYVMELLEGLDLESLVLKYGPVPPGRVLRLLMQACRSLAEAHDAGLVHRDIKPANLFVCRAADELDVVKVLDFGLVRALAGGEDAPLSTEEVLNSTTNAGYERPDGSKLTRAGTVMGTPEFMAPEQALGQRLDGRADLYALGCVGYWLLTGQLLFKKDTPMMLLIAHINEPTPPLAAHASSPVPHGLELCIMDCLAKSADHRPQNARELLARLTAAERELSPEQLWTEEHARAWWHRHQPPQRSSSPSGLTPSPQAQIRIADAPASPRR
jgi:serine/threonine protein kinase